MDQLNSTDVGSLNNIRSQLGCKINRTISLSGFYCFPVLIAPIPFVLACMLLVIVRDGADNGG